MGGFRRRPGLCSLPRKRLLTEEEWQYAAQGPGGREYPWSGGLRVGVCNLSETRETPLVKAFSAGKSPPGCYDICGKVKQWTESERNDGRTRFHMIRGRSHFAPKAPIGMWMEDRARPTSPPRFCSSGHASIAAQPSASSAQWIWKADQSASQASKTFNTTKGL